MANEELTVEDAPGRMTALTRLDTQHLLEMAVDKGANMETLERLIGLAERVRSMQAREAWYSAMAKFQAADVRIVKTTSATIATRSGGSFSYKFAPLEEILDKIQPVMGPLGLSVSWPKGAQPQVQADKVVVFCRVSHSLGHYEDSDDIPIPIPTEGGANPAQRVGIALSYGKRYSLLAIIGKQPEVDTDGVAHGDTAAKVQQQEERGDGGATVDADALITEREINRLTSIARGMKWPEDQAIALLKEFKYEQRADIRMRDYEAIIARFKKGPGA